MVDDLKKSLFEIVDKIKVADSESDEESIRKMVKGILECVVKNNKIDWEAFYREEKRIRRDWEKRIEIFIHVLKVFKVAGILSRLENTVFVLVKDGEILKSFYLYGRELFPAKIDDARKLAKAYEKLTKQEVELFQMKRV